MDQLASVISNRQDPLSNIKGKGSEEVDAEQTNQAHTEFRLCPKSQRTEFTRWQTSSAHKGHP